MPVRTEPDRDALGGALEAYLQRVLANDTVRLRRPPVDLAGGYVNRILAIDLEGADLPDSWRSPLVVRLAPAWATEAKLAGEDAVQRFVRALGYPVPEPLLLEVDRDVLGGPFQVMTRAPGRPLLDELTARPTGAFHALGQMADLLAQLHDLPLHDLPASVGRADEQALTALSVHEVPGLAVVNWLTAVRPPVRVEVLCHLDFHPINVLVDGGRPTAVLDWENAGLGDPAHDLADAALVLRSAPSDLPAWLRPAEALARDGLARRLLARYRTRRRVTSEALHYYTVLSASRRLLGAVRDAAPAGGAPRGLSTPEYIQTLAGVIERRTGIRPRTS